MKTKNLYVLAADGMMGGLYLRLVLASLIIALLFAFVPATIAYAAPASGGDLTDKNLELEWKNKLSHLRSAGLFFDRVRLYPADFEDRDDLARAQYYLDKYGFALKQANTVVFNHSGFDIQGNVINEIQAAETVQELAMYLHMMRGLRDKIEEQGYKIHLLK
jgi:hypothetical protein